MTSGNPKTKAAELNDQVNALVGQTTRWLTPDDMRLRRLIRQAEQLIGADPAEGHSSLAALYQLTGDREITLHHADNAIQLAPGNPLYFGNKATNLGNLGYFSEAQAFYERAIDPEKGKMTSGWSKGYIFGAFRTMRRHLDKARKMQLDLENLDTNTAERASAILEKVEATDADIGKVLDVLGGVVRQHRLFYAGSAPRVSVFDVAGQEPFVEMVFDFDVSPAEAHQFYVEFVDQVIATLPTAPSVLSVSCRSWKQQYERSAA